MAEFILEVILWTIPEATGHALIYIFTLGRVKASETVAEIIGVIFWILVFVVIAIFLFR